MFLSGRKGTIQLKKAPAGAVHDRGGKKEFETEGLSVQKDGFRMDVAGE